MSRQLFPINQITPVEVINNRPITQEQYDALLNQIQQYEAQVSCTSAEFEQLKNDLESAWSTQTLTADTVNAITACLNNIEATTVQATTVQASNAVFASHFQGTTAYMQCLTTACNVCTPTVNADNVNATRVNTSCVVTDNITVNNTVNYNNTNTACATITNADISCATITDASIHEAAVFCLDADTVQACTGCIETAHITDADIANQLDTYKFTAEFIKHNKGAQAQTLVTPADFYIELPYFANGSYRLISKDSNENELWSITVRNESTNNYVITWSSNEALTNYLEDLYIYQNKFYFHGNSNGKAQTIYHISDTLENELDPTIYTDGWPFDTASLDVQKYWVFQFAHGTKFFRNVSFANDTAITSPLRLINCDDVECANLPKTYDTTEDTNVVLYQPDQNLNTTSCVTFNRITAADVVDPDTGIVTSVNEATLPNLNNTNLNNPHLFIGSCDNFNIACQCTGSLIACTEDGQFKVKCIDCDTCVKQNPVATLNANCFTSDDPDAVLFCDGRVVAYDATDGSLKPISNPGFDGLLTGDLTVTGCSMLCGPVTIGCDLHVNGDAYVSGTLHYTEEETINSTADHLILRQNNSTALTAGQYSGIVVNNPTGNGCGSAIVVDCTATARIGNVAPSETTYTDIYLSKSDGKWYSDDTLTTEVTPNGDLTAWSSSDDTEDYKHYADAVFTVYSYTDTQPLATRSEESCMAPDMPTVWNATCKRIETTAPSNGCACMGLVTCIDSLTGCLGMTWQDMHPAATLCRYESMACYCADVANICANTMVIIDDECDYVFSEDR